MDNAEKKAPPQKQDGAPKAQKGRRRRRGLAIALAAGLLAALFVLSPLFPFVRSMAVMGVYSRFHHRQSLPASQGIRLRIPGGLSTPEADWYPFVMTFVADEAYAAYIGEPDARLTILYNFPAFSLARGSSNLYNAASPYYNSFYGAYLVRDSHNAALAAGTPDAQAVGDIARFDFFHLVLRDFGIARGDEVFEFSLTGRQGGLPYAGHDGWTRLEFSLTVNGSAHNRRQSVTSYLQYGAPRFGPVAHEFAPVEMQGLVYARYFAQWDVGVYFYVMAPDEAVCRACDEKLLSKSTLEGAEQ